MTTSCFRPFDSLPPGGGGAPAIRVFQLPRAAIQWLTALTEAHDGIALVRTLDEDRGLVECWVMPDFEAAFGQLIASMKKHWPLQELGVEFE
jgi:hypothetical protein